MSLPAIVCQRCGKVAPKRGNGPQRYCVECSAISSREKRGGWARKIGTPRRRSEITERGLEISRTQNIGLLHSFRQPDLAWSVKVAVPFDWAASKNHIYALRAAGHVALRGESTAFRDLVSWRLKEALRGQRVAQNKVWIEIFVQKPNHRGDAINLVDLICDAVKVAIGVDDRWFSIRSVDWQIVKNDPLIYVGVGQEETHDVLACSSCGRILPPISFQKRRGGPLGVSRNCRDCSRARRRPGKPKNATAGSPALPAAATLVNGATSDLFANAAG